MLSSQRAYIIRFSQSLSELVLCIKLTFVMLSVDQGWVQDVLQALLQHADQKLRLVPSTCVCQALWLALLHDWHVASSLESAFLRCNNSMFVTMLNTSWFSLPSWSQTASAFFHFFSVLSYLSWTLLEALNHSQLLLSIWKSRWMLFVKHNKRLVGSLWQYTVLSEVITS